MNECTMHEEMDELDLFSGSVLVTHLLGAAAEEDLPRVFTLIACHLLEEASDTRIKSKSPQIPKHRGER